MIFGRTAFWIWSLLANPVWLLFILFSVQSIPVRFLPFILSSSMPPFICFMYIDSVASLPVHAYASRHALWRFGFVLSTFKSCIIMSPGEFTPSYWVGAQPSQSHMLCHGRLNRYMYNQFCRYFFSFFSWPLRHECISLLFPHGLGELNGDNGLLYIQQRQSLIETLRAPRGYFY